MNRQKKNYMGKVGYCDNAALGIIGKDGKPMRGGHYVYIRKVIGNRCDVNIITSLEDRNEQYQLDKVGKVKKGYLYPIPKSDANFTLWSAINLDGNIKGVKVSDIQAVGQKKIKNRHKFYVGKYTKNNPQR